MEGSPNLNRQSCYTCLRPDIPGLSRRFFDDFSYRRLDSHGYAPTETRRAAAGGLRWRRLWRRILSNKRGILYSASTVEPPAPYDSCTYAQNFDEGTARVEQENLSRSFTARFADSSALRRIG